MTDMKTICINQLQALRNNVTPEDKRDAVEKLDITRQTIERYLSGDVRRLSIAIQIIEFFKPIVNERLKSLVDVDQ